jgi:hypothetical protein
MKEQIKAANAQSTDPAATVGVDRSALRREVKGLLRAWKQLKKQQKRERRQLQRENKQRRRQEKRERRQAKRETKHAARETKRQQHRGHHGPFGMPPMPPMPPMPHLPPMPPMPHMPHIPPVHPHMTMPMPMPMPMPGTYGQPPHGDTHPRSAPPTTEFTNPLFNLWGGGGHNTNNTNQAPGAWPSDNNHNHVPNDEGIASTAPPPSYTASQAKYQAAWDMEAKVAEKEAELLKLHERIAEGYSVEDRSGGGSGQGEKGTEGPSKIETEALAVEREVEELARAMERLRTEADEEFARELAKEEERGFRG